MTTAHVNSGAWYLPAVGGAGFNQSTRANIWMRAIAQLRLGCLVLQVMTTAHVNSGDWFLSAGAGTGFNQSTRASTWMRDIAQRRSGCSVLRVMTTVHVNSGDWCQALYQLRIGLINVLPVSVTLGKI
jgi:hypothetical protein